MGEKTDQPAGKASQPAVNKIERSQDDMASTSSSGASVTAPTESKAKPIENIRIAVILLGMGLAIFLGALVRPARKDLQKRPTEKKLISSAGHEYRGDRHPSHYQ